MLTTLNSIVSREHNDDLLRAAQRSRRYTTETPASPAPVEIRMATREDARALRRLAQLDDATELEGDALLALIAGHPVAALSLTDGRVVADPFIRSLHAVELLNIRADYLLGRRQPRRRWTPRPRFA
jgi:hypothetical protein